MLQWTTHTAEAGPKRSTSVFPYHSRPALPLDVLHLAQLGPGWLFTRKKLDEALEKVPYFRQRDSSRSSSCSFFKPARLPPEGFLELTCRSASSSCLFVGMSAPAQIPPCLSNFPHHFTSRSSPIMLGELGGPHLGRFVGKLQRDSRGAVVPDETEVELTTVTREAV